MEANRARAIRQTVHAMIFGEAPQRALAPAHATGIKGAPRSHTETVRALRIVASVRALLS